MSDPYEVEVGKWMRQLASIDDRERVLPDPAVIWLKAKVLQTAKAAERVARSGGLEVVDVEWKIGKQRFLRVYIDRVPKPAAVISDAAGTLGAGEIVHDPFPKISHADCERVSQQLSVILDVEDLVPGPGYILEVSSPGMDRALKKAADFERFRGRLAKITTAEPVGDTKYFEGRLAGFTNGKVRMELKGKEARTVELPLEAIRKANLVVEF